MLAMELKLFAVIILFSLSISVADSGNEQDSRTLRSDGCDGDEISLVQVRQTLTQSDRLSKTKAPLALNSSEDEKIPALGRSTSSRWRPPFQKPWEAMVEKALEHGRRWWKTVGRKVPGMKERAKRAVGDAMKVAGEQLIAGKTAADTKSYTLRVDKEFPWRWQEHWREAWQDVVNQAMDRGKRWESLLARKFPKEDTAAMEVVGDAMKFASDKVAQDSGHDEAADLHEEDMLEHDVHKDVEIPEVPGLGGGPWSQFINEALSSGKEWRDVLDGIPAAYQGRRRWGEIRKEDLQPDRLKRELAGDSSLSILPEKPLRPPLGGDDPLSIANKAAMNSIEGMPAQTNAELATAGGVLSGPPVSFPPAGLADNPAALDPDLRSNNYLSRQSTVADAYLKAQTAAVKAAMTVERANIELAAAAAADDSEAWLAATR